MCDPISAFGGVIAINSVLNKKIAYELNKVFIEVILAKGYKNDALRILKKRKNIRLIDYSKFKLTNEKNYLFLNNSFLSQDFNNVLFNEKIKIVSKKKPTSKQFKDL